jgi:hypothetical protein
VIDCPKMVGRVKSHNKKSHDTREKWRFRFKVQRRCRGDPAMIIKNDKLVVCVAPLQLSTADTA